MQIQAYTAASQPSTQFIPARSTSSPTFATAANSAPLATNKAAKQDQVSLSDAGRALAEQGQDALENGTKILGDLTRQTLSSLGLSSKADALGAKIEFDSFSYSAKSSTSLSATHSYYQTAAGYQDASSLQFHDEQQTEIIGRGRITTADGRSFAFESQLQLSQSTDFSQSVVRQGNSSSDAVTTPISNRFARQAPSQADSSTGQNVFALRNASQSVSTSSALFSAIDDILNKIAASNTSAASHAGKHVLDPIKDLLSQAFDTPGEKVVTPTEERAGIAIGEPNPNAVPQGIAVGEPNPNAAPRGFAIGEPDPSARSSTTHPGVAVGEPNPNANTSRSADLFNTKQLQEGAARIARQLDQFSSPATKPQLATAA